MWQMIYPIMMIVAANTFYNICAKSSPKGVNSFAALIVTYSVAAVLSVVMLFVTSGEKNIASQFSKLNWSAPVMGIVIVGLELGYLLAYKNGWQMNRVSVTANIVLAVILVLVSAVFYKESITLRQIGGIAVCAAGLLLISL